MAAVEVATAQGAAASPAEPCTEVGLLIDKYGLVPHPEGGYYKETYRAEAAVDASYGTRAASTAIYFLITPGSVSRFHRIRADEVWHFYLGGPFTVVELTATGAKTTTLGRDVFGATPQCVQHVVKAGTWFGSFPNEGSDYSFVGCTVAPGFDFADFEMGSRADLIAAFPEAPKDLILKLTDGLP